MNIWHLYGQVDIIFTLPHDKNKWYNFFTALSEQREEMYSGDKMLDVYEEYFKLWKKIRYNRNVYRFDLFENAIGEHKEKLYNLLKDE